MERQFGPYRLVHQIATGGMAEIHLAKIKGIGGFEKYVALKMIHPNFSADDHFIQMLIDEAKITVQLQHVNVAHIFDLGRVGDTFYITMEFVDGCDLYKVLRKASEQDRPMPLDVAAYIAKEACMGLDYAHRKRDGAGQPLGIVHRDVSPQNVLLSHVGEVKIVDFGIAKASMRARQTAAGVIKGKYYYMSPEQAWGDPVDHRTDIFSAGILLYEMLTGQMLYLEEDMQKLLDMVRKAEIPPPSSKRSDVPRELDQIVMKALQKKAANRYQSAQDFGGALEKFLHSRAPDFSTGRLTSFMATVLAEPSPAPPPAPAPAPARPAPARPAPAPPRPPVAAAPVRRDAAIVTQGLGREAIMSSRDEFSDENSVIFRLADLAKGKNARGGPAGRPSQEEPTREGLPTAPRRAGTAPLHGAKPAAPAPAAPAPAAPPAQKRPSGAVRLPNVPTAEVAPPGEREDQTMISAPPGFRNADTPSPADDLFGPPPGFDSGDQTGDRLLGDLDDQPTGVTRALPESGVPGEDSDEPTRLDIGLPADVSSASVRPAPAGPADHGFGAPDLDDPFDEVLDPATLRRSSKDRERESGSQRPAVSQLAPARASRRTPMSGVPIANVPGVGAPLASPPLPPLPPLPTAATPLGAAPLLAEDPPGSRPVRDLPLNAPADTPLPFRLAELKPPAPRAPASHQSSPSEPEGDRLRPPPSPWDIVPQGPGPDLTAVPEWTGEGSLSDVARVSPDRRPLWLMLGGGVLLALVIILVVVVAGSGDDGPAAPTTVKLEVISIPPGATVAIDGKRVGGVTPLVHEVTPGKSYRLRVELERHEAWERDTKVGGGESVPETMKVVAALQPIMGTLHVRSRPPAAEVLLNGAPIGRTPLDTRLDPFRDGTLEIRLRGHKAARRPLKWGGSREVTIDVDLAQAN